MQRHVIAALIDAFRWVREGSEEMHQFKPDISGDRQPTVQGPV